MSAQIAHQRREFVITSGFNKAGDVSLIADLVHQALAPCSAPLEGERRVELIGASVDPVAQLFATRFCKCGLLQLSVLQYHNVPAEIAENRFKTRPKTLPHHSVKALAVVVYHPPGVAKTMLPSFQKGLEDVAFIHLGIADEGNHL